MGSVFSANETLDAWVGRSLDDWTTFHEAGTRLTDYLRHVGMDGLMMENTWTSTDGKEKVVMHTRDVVQGKVDEALFSTAGYEIQDMSSFSMFGQ